MIRRFAVVILSALLLVSAFVGSASAAKPTQTGRAKAVMTVIGGVDKNGNFTPAGGAGQKSGGVSPSGVTYGDCGTSWIWPYSEGFTDTQGIYHTRMRLDMGAQSTLGAIVQINWFWSASGPAYYTNNGVNYPFSSTWSRTEYRTDIPAGGYNVGLTVTATLWNGTVCQGDATDWVAIN